MTPKPTTIFLDANVLYSRTLRDWLWLLMIESGKSGSPNRLEPRLSEDVLAELLYRIRRAHRQLSDAEVGGIRRRLLEGHEHCVVTGYGVPDLPMLADQNDLHVVGAATHASVDYLVSDDKGLHEAADEFDFEVYTADDMLCLIAERRRDLLLQVTRLQLRYWRRRAAETGSDFRQLDDALKYAGAPAFAKVVKKTVQTIALSGRY